MTSFRKIQIRLQTALLLALSTIAISAQDVVFSDGSVDFFVVEGEEIEVFNKHITLAWSSDSTFLPPFEVVQSYKGDIILSKSTSIASVVVDAAKKNPTDICITAASGKSKKFVIQRHILWSRYVLAVLAIIIIGMSTVVLVYRKLMKKTHDAAMAAIDSANERQITRYESSTVLFSDIQGFTKITEHMNPEQLIDELDKYFIYFDELVEKYSVEKIKTIGDAYMCAGGVPHGDSANAIEVVLVGLGMIAFVRERQINDDVLWNIRVGINTGSVISGLLGHTKKTFDIWGDAVNTASRMESSGAAGKVNISGNTYHQIKDYFECEYRGKMPAKYKGELDMYFVTGLKPEYAYNGLSHVPNALLTSKMQAMKTQDLIDVASEKIIGPVHANAQARFEAFIHSIGVLAQGEQMKDNNIIVCKTAAAIWFARAISPENYDKIIKNTESRLKKMHFSIEQIETILHTTQRLAQGKRPESLIEEIIFDARYEYLGRKDVQSYLMDWHKEHVETTGKKTSKKEWLNEHKKIASNLGFYTATAKRLAELEPQAQQKNLEQIIRQY